MNMKISRVELVGNFLSSLFRFYSISHILFSSVLINTGVILFHITMCPDHKYEISAVSFALCDILNGLLWHECYATKIKLLKVTQFLYFFHLSF